MNFPSSVVSQFPSCTKSLTIRVPETTVHLKQGREVIINGEEVQDLPVWANDIFVKKASSLFLMAYLPNGIEVWWDGQTRAYIDAPPELRGLTAGLCGTFNDNQKDDFLTPEGDIEQDPIAFANKWKTLEKCHDTPLSEDAHPCDRHAQNKDLAVKYCAKLKSRLFAKCHLEVDPEPFYRDCTYDLCSCEAELRDCMCPILSAYGKECAHKGILVDWRAKIRECGLHCTGGQVYQICGDSCSHSCYDMATNPSCRRKCVEGCNCPEGFSLDVNEVCIPVSQCPCVYQGREYKPSYEMFQVDSENGSEKLCKCENVRWNCREPTEVERTSPEFFTEPQIECLDSSNEAYTDCMPAEELTCMTMHLRPEKKTDDLCRPGCRCDPGYVRDPDTNACIRYSECPCHHGGRSYQEGNSIVEECNTCVCENGLWVCSDDPCPAICTAWGDSHFKTFDGRMFDFHGTCDYMLAKGKISTTDAFEVSIQNVPCGTNGVTCAKSLTLRVGSGDEQEVIKFSRSKPINARNISRTIIREAGLFTIAEVGDMGVELQWDKGTRVYVILDPSWKGERVQGLCGNYNDDEKDDFRTPSGGTGEVSAKIFGDSWRLQNYCPESILIKDTCSLHPHRKVWAAEKCAILKSHVFQPCHSEVPVEPYIERCQFDSCGCDTGGDCECLCTAVAAYAQECNIHGVYIKWRTPEFCPMQCDESCEHYEPCIPTCLQETCDSYKEPQSTLCRQDACVEGCAKDVCPPGQVHKSTSDKECVPVPDCDRKCLDIDGIVFLEGDIISEDDCHTCYCTKNKKICKGTPCETTTYISTLTPKVTTPSLVMTTPATAECRSGWTIWINADHPVINKKNSDIEYIPDNVPPTLDSRGFCGNDMYAAIKCRSVGDHQMPRRGVICNLEEGLKCLGSKAATKGGQQCADYEISLLCDCSKEHVTTIPASPSRDTPVTAPPIDIPVDIPVIPDIPETCEFEGWTPWYNSHFPTDLGEFETLENIRKTESFCPDHYVKEVDCRPVGSPGPGTLCSNKGAICRNNAGRTACKDYEIRAMCECKCQDGLGMENGDITDDRISASTSKTPTFGRLNSDAAWMPELEPDEKLSSSWLQIDLQKKQEVTGIITQGHPTSAAFVTAFAVQVSKTGSKWEEIRSNDTDFTKIFMGNSKQRPEVTNLFPKSVYVRYVRIIPLEAVGLPAIRIELKGCDLIAEEPSTTLRPFLPGFTPTIATTALLMLPTICQDGWTDWMNSHIPSPGDWDDFETYESLRLRYSFCGEEEILRVQCRVASTDTMVDDAGQEEVVCNKNIGLQCLDDLQPEHCFDYEIRYYCDCAIPTSTFSVVPEVVPSTTPKDVYMVGELCEPDITAPTKPHLKDCQKFYECHPTWTGHRFIEKSCGSGTLYNPLTFVCDHPHVVTQIRPECDDSLKLVISTTSKPTTKVCSDHYWTEWFNTSHPEVDDGDVESIKNIRLSGLPICAQEYIMDIECQFNKIQKSSSKSSRKGGGSQKGKRKPEKYSSSLADYTQSEDLNVECSTSEGLLCQNIRQRGRNCEDYAIRVLCSCEARRPTVITGPYTITTTLPSLNYTDVRAATPTTSPLMYMDYWCPPGRHYEEYAIKCSRVCIYYRQILKQQGKCLEDDEEAPACVDEVSGLACPPGYFLRNNSTCVSITNCNCMLPNGMSAPPERTFLVADCEICVCSSNELICDNTRCFDKIKEFECDEWSPWISVSAPSGEGDIETLDILRRYHPAVCSEPTLIECREISTGLPADKTRQKVTCNTRTGFECLNRKNPGGCKDYEVRVICKCEKETYKERTPPPFECTEPHWTEWFNITHPHIKGGDYELLDVITRDGHDICPKEYISKIDCAFYKETRSGLTKGSKKGGKKVKPMKYTSSYELVDYTESDDMYVTCSKFSGLTCVNSLQAKSKRCKDYAIRAYCECTPSDVDISKEKTTPFGTTSTTPYPGWPVVGPQCDVGKEKVECAIPCSRICMFYEYYVQLNGECGMESDCASACMNPHDKLVCPDDLYMADNTTCVEVADCTCRLPSGQPVPGGTKIQVSECEWCECSNNFLLCETVPGCVTRPKEVIAMSSTVSYLRKPRPTLPVFTTLPPLSLIKIRCNEWTPWMNMRRTAEGDFQRIEDLRAQYEELCEKPINISCRDAIAKLSYDQLGQTLTCSPSEGLICKNAENREACFDYEVSLFCKCEVKPTSPGELVKTTTEALLPTVTIELMPCDAWSPWINEHRPWLEDGDTEYKSLQQLRDQLDFCLEGEISSIECLEAASGVDISVNKNVRCDQKYGLRCRNSEQSTGVCFDFKIRYYCSCGTTVATRPTLITAPTQTPPSVCSPVNYINLLEDVPDSAFSATSTLGANFAPAAAARLYGDTASAFPGGAWYAGVNDKNQYLQIDLGHLHNIYGFYISGSRRAEDKARVTSFTVQVSEDTIIWSPVSLLLFQGPLTSNEEKQIILPEPTEAQFVRFLPNTWTEKIAMRVEIIGCLLPTPAPVPTTTRKPICYEDMGFENGEFSNSQITASSVYQNTDFFNGKQYARLNSQPIPQESIGAWIAEPTADQFIRFDFLQPSKLSGIVTQGRPETDEFVESYIIRYSPDGKSWNTLKNPKTGNDKIFSGNYDGNTPIENLFDRVIEAQYLELRPIKWNKNIALRVEVKGCFHPYPEVATVLAPSTTTLLPPPPFCSPCSGLPKEYYDKCKYCEEPNLFDGADCVIGLLCPCYHDGRIYPLDRTFETKDCELCTCQLGGTTKCEPMKCDPCEREGETPVITPSCTCVCKPCPSGTKLCPTSDFCLEEEKWCDGIEHCLDDEDGCPTLAPPECPVPECPEEWELVLELEGDEINCPKYVCEAPKITTPMSCPPPLCPFGFSIVLVPKKLGETCPRYECVPPSTTLEPYTCPPPTCPDGYEAEVDQDSYDQFVQELNSYGEQQSENQYGCPEYRCVTSAPPTAPCPPPSCPQGYDVTYPDSSDMLSLCPIYQCIPIITTTQCPPVRCPPGLQILYVKSEGEEICSQYTCIRITTPVFLTTPMPTAPPCREVALPVCDPGEEIYQTNPNDPCPIFSCKKLGAPPPTTAAPKVITPTCKVTGKDFTTFDRSEFRLEPCEHILARDKITKEWQISIHSSCQEEGTCGRYIKITENNHTVQLNPNLSVMWDEHSYSVLQTNKIGETSKNFTISKMGDTVVYKSKIHNYTVVWTADTNVQIELNNDNVIYQVDGLCGFYTGSPVDDRTKPDGSLATSTQEYGDSWSLMKDGCKEKPEKCSAEESKKAFLLCKALESKPFTECHEVLPPASFLKGCVDRLCVCLKESKTEEECKCGVLASYITACLKLKPAANVADWRIATKCYKKCPSGEVYNDCFKASCENSCDTLKDPDSCAEDTKGACISGCFCEPGLVRQGNSCVTPEKCRNCICEGYGDPHYKSFDRRNFTFNGRCSYVAARDIDPTGKHHFQVITRNKNCQKGTITMCTEAVKILFEDHKIEITLLPTDVVVVALDGKAIEVFPYREPWIAIENPDNDHILLIIFEIQLEVTYSRANYGFTIRLPSHLFNNKLEGLCGNCNFDPVDDFRTIDGTVVESVKDFGRSWLIDSDETDCSVINKEDLPCMPPPPESDPCLKLMEKDIFGECHPLEDPVAYVSSCQLDLCVSSDELKSACQSFEAYSRRCGQLGVCLDWRKGELFNTCPKKCPEGLEYSACGPGCVRTCDNYDKDLLSCPLSRADGCYCPPNTVLDNGTCVNENRCVTCDSEGHRVGDVWTADPCTTCECNNEGGAICRTKSCSLEPVCSNGFIIKEIPGTEDECCGPQKVCKVKPVTDCPEPTAQICDYGKKQKLIEAPGVCPEYICVCLSPDECPKLEKPSDTQLEPGEKWEIDKTGCCARYVTNCTGHCPQPDCPKFYEANFKELKPGVCCQDYICEPPADSCIYDPRFFVVDGFERPMRDNEIGEKTLYKVGEKWFDGLCIECDCEMDVNKKPNTKCFKKTCTSISEHPDRKDYVLEELPVPDACCPQIIRTGCIDDGNVFKVNTTQYDAINGCRSVECKQKDDGVIEKVEQMFSCDENCPLGWEYRPSPLAPIVCCGSCEQVACDDDGELKEIGDTWSSDDFCLQYECVRSESTDKIQTRSKEVQCIVPTEEERTMYKFKETKILGQCCKKYTKEQCLFVDGSVMPAGVEMVDPSNKCLNIVCELSPNGNVTRKEIEQKCSKSCPLGHTYMEPEPNSKKCCEKCLQTQCVHDEQVHSVGETWENPKDICYQYTCQMRDDDFTVIAVKRDCPYFDSECPAEKILQDPTACCQICNITRVTKKECAPEEIDPADTIGMFVLEARTVGRCTNPNPVTGFKRCHGQCDSRTAFKAKGIEARHISECDCCRPSRYSQVEVVLQCNRGYNFQRVYDNIEACECQECEGLQRDQYYNDQSLINQPLKDPTEFYVPLNQEELVN